MEYTVSCLCLERKLHSDTETSFQMAPEEESAPLVLMTDEDQH